MDTEATRIVNVHLQSAQHSTHEQKDNTSGPGGVLTGGLMSGVLSDDNQQASNTHNAARTTRMTRGTHKTDNRPAHSDIPLDTPTQPYGVPDAAPEMMPEKRAENEQKKVRVLPREDGML